MNRIFARRPARLKRPLHRRAAALLGALAFLLGTVGEGFGLHPCPHHDGGYTTEHGAGPEAPGAGNGSGHPDHGEHADHASPGGADRLNTGSGHSPEESHTGPCTCGSACQPGSAAALPVHSQGEPESTAGGDRPSSLDGTRLAAIVRPPYFLPFSQAPPRQG